MNRSLKRGRTEATTFEFFLSKKQECFPRFHVMHSENENTTMRKMSPFLVSKCLSNLIGAGYKAQKMSNGDLLIEVKDKTQCDKLLKVDKIGDTAVTVSPHRSMNTVRGVISEADLLDLTENELLEGFHEQNVIKVQRIVIRRDNKEIPTKHIVLTFGTTVLPETVEAGYVKIRVRPYIPNPRRCYTCQKFGHGSQSCRGKQTCAKCSKTDHVSESCTAPPHCVNCSGDHAAYSRSCQQWKKEKEIIALKVKENISYPEARRRLAITHKIAYADVARQGAAPRAATVQSGTSLRGPEETSSAPQVQTATPAAPQGNGGPKTANVSAAASRSAQLTNTTETVVTSQENRRPAKAPGLKPSTKKPSLEAMDTSEPSSASITPKDRHKPLERTNSQELIKKAELPKVSPTGKGSGS